MLDGPCNQQGKDEKKNCITNIGKINPKKNGILYIFTEIILDFRFLRFQDSRSKILRTL